MKTRHFTTNRAVGEIAGFRKLLDDAPGLVTICSGLYLLMGVTSFPLSGFSLILSTNFAGHVTFDFLRERAGRPAIRETYTKVRARSANEGPGTDG